MDLLSGFSFERPRPTRLMPTWDPSLVLRSLLSLRLSLFDQASIEFLTFKTVCFLCLLALDSGARVSEFNVFDCNFIHF
jgi:hypothetical protein